MSGFVQICPLATDANKDKLLNSESVCIVCGEMFLLFGRGHLASFDLCCFNIEIMKVYFSNVVIKLDPGSSFALVS